MSDTPETFRSLVRDFEHDADVAERIGNYDRSFHIYKLARELSALIDAWERRMVELQRESGTVTINSILWRMLGPKEQAADGDSERRARARPGLR